MAFGVDDAIAGAGVVGNFVTGRSAANAQKEAMRRQAQLIQRQTQTYAQAQPAYNQLLQQYMANAGLGPSAGVTQQAPGQFGLQNRSQQFGLGGGFGSYEDQLRLQGAQEDIARHQMQGANQLRFQLGQRGLADASIGAALGRNAALGQQQYGQFRRQLAIQAPQEQERRMAALQGLIGMGFGQGGAASAGYGQQAGVYGNQANQAYNAIGGIAQNWQQQNALQNYMNQYGVNPAGGYGGTASTGVLGGMTGGGYGAGATGYHNGGMPTGQYGSDYYIDPNGEVRYF